MPNGLAIAAALLVLHAHGGNLPRAGTFMATSSAAAQARDGDARRGQYASAQSREKMKDTEGARGIYQRLADSGDAAWSQIGRSALARLGNRLDESLAAANKAADAGGSIPEAHFERGLVLMARRDYDGAAAAFDRSLMLDGSNAAAHYYGGLADYRAKRVDRMAAHFEAFLRLAPDAPERPEVESIMRTIRGK